MLSHKDALATEISKFRQWAVPRQSPEFQPNQILLGTEWECDYPDRQQLYGAVADFLAAAAHRSLSNDELELLLYVLARDNEDEHILETLERYPAIAAQVAVAAVSSSDIQARVQAALLAGRVGLAEVVRRFLDDEAEYVRRRAGFALQEIKSRT